MDNTQATTLSDVVETHEFLENPLDVYETYTYNIEWFVVDIDSDRKFQEFGETLSVVEVVNDGWPGIEDTKITIAKTGVTTEFNITDLTVEGSGAGIAETSKIAGTALTLDFTVTEVGTTSLVDNLQNAIALCGWKSIDQTHFYMKINFLGVDANGKKVKIPQTKVLTFTLQRLTNLQSQTDAKGTTTVLRGTILQDSVIGNKLAIGSTEYAFTYEVADSLIDTLGVEEEEKPPKENSFIDELNKSVRVTHPNLLLNLQNTYKITMSDQFKEKFGAASMTGITSSTIKNISNVHADRQVGQVTPLLNIFKIIDDICLNALEIKEELTKDTPKRSKVYKITPWLVPKEGGWNAITGTMAYNVEFFIDFEKKFITQHPLDAANKAANINTTIQQLFKELHINKIYHYLFTGKNDQILDFNITLDSYLAKVYSAPTDWYAYENILKASTIEGNATIDGYRQRYEDTIERGKTLIALEAESATNLKKMTKDFNNFDDSLRNDMLDAYTASLSTGAKNEKGKGAHKKEAAAFFANKSTEDLMDQLSKIEGFKLDIGERRKNRDKWEKLTTDALSKHNTDYRKMNAWQDSQDTLYEDWMASSASVTGEENWKNGVKQNAQKLLSGVANKNPKNMILLEELDDDIISKMSNEDFESVLRSQANNPVVYKNLITTLSKNPSAVTIKPTDVEKVELARAKYYESKTNDVSMIKANLTIKGDPHWIDGYMPPAVAKREFGDVGAVSNKGYSMQTTLNGYNYLILKSGVAAGTDLHNNILKRNLLTHLYTVNNVVSDFSQGLFTQTLSLTRLTDADDLASVVPTVGPSLVELDDVNDNKQLLDSKVAEEKAKVDVADNENELVQSSVIKAELSTDEEKINDIITFDTEKFNENWELRNKRIREEKVIKDAKKLEVARHEQMEIYNDRLEETTDDIVLSNDVAPLGQHPYPFIDNMVRKNLADDFLLDTSRLTTACNEGKTESCTGLSESKNKILEIFEITPGVTPTIAEVEAQLNNSIATAGPNFIITAEEIAMYQIAANGELNITGFDPVDIGKIVEDTIGIRTAEVILDDTDKSLGANLENKLLNGSDLLVEVETDNTLINVPAYTWSKELYNNQIMHPNSNGPMDFNDMPQTWFKQKVDNTVIEAKPRDAAMLKLRTLEVIGIADSTLTIDELADVTTLSKGINDTIFNGSLRDQHGTGLIPEILAKEYLWTDNAFEVLDTDITNSGLIIAEDDKDALKVAIATQIHQSTSLDALEENDYLTVKKYENEINKINAAAYADGHRGDVTTAVQVGTIQGELEGLNTKLDEINAEPTQYFWDPNGRRVWLEEKEDIEANMARLMTGQPDQFMTAVVTTTSGFDKTYININNPTNTLDYQPVIIKNLETGEYDVLLSGEDNTYGGAAHLDQLAEAKSLFYHLTRMDRPSDTKTFEDDIGREFVVKDFSNISSITLADGTPITNPSTTFGLYTLDPNNMVPANIQDYVAIRKQIADYFPNIKVISSTDGFAPVLSTLKDGTGQVILNGAVFIIDPTP